MFRKRKRFPYKILFFIIACSFIITGFLIGYYRTTSPREHEIPYTERYSERTEINYEAITENQENNLEANEEDEGAYTDEERAVTQYEASIREETTIIYKTQYTICQNTLEERISPMNAMIGLTQEGLQEYLQRNNLLFHVESFSNEEVVLFQKKNAVCPMHYEQYFVTQQDGYITIFYFDETGGRKIIEKTTISISVLPYIDQQKLTLGIFRKTKEEAYQLLEDYSS
ncbi:BofC C-terminal domain-containing protein [Natronincola peptidivorans]|uniref:BofC C-terminal domain-containing protein n=1 Tax=Natronincola peptidivorans TaxID=426128 RepID=A0A1H9YXV6_9FIRM|nr:BofC C-terminal domain-containing protein [Natronincola peptidivorans]SES73940.1 BofC C-terminal domain-containing protein [Natronincola peptidivorans]